MIREDHHRDEIRLKPVGKGHHVSRPKQRQRRAVFIPAARQVNLIICIKFEVFCFCYLYYAGNPLILFS